MKRAEHRNVKQPPMEWYRMAKTGSSMTCAHKKKSCVHKCVTITEDNEFYLMVKMYHLKAIIHGAIF
jgi:hypothetical protein